jgi:hypothetical protein
MTREPVQQMLAIYILKYIIDCISGEDKGNILYLCQFRFPKVTGVEDTDTDMIQTVAKYMITSPLKCCNPENIKDKINDLGKPPGEGETNAILKKKYVYHLNILLLNLFKHLYSCLSEISEGGEHITKYEDPLLTKIIDQITEITLPSNEGLGLYVESNSPANHKNHDDTIIGKIQQLWLTQEINLT